MVQIKRGDTFAFYANITDDLGAAINVPLANLRCQIRTESGNLIDTMTVKSGGEVGKYLFEAGDTKNWPVGNLQYDIKINYEGKITSTETEVVVVTKDVTRYE